jgi:hypothetical protein
VSCRDKCTRQKKLQKKDCVMNLIQLRMRFEVAEVSYIQCGLCELSFILCTVYSNSLLANRHCPRHMETRSMVFFLFFFFLRSILLKN